MGMSESELSSALHIGRPPEDRSGRSEFGMGLKTAACWFGNQWSLRTNKLGEEVGHAIHFNVEEVASGNSDLQYEPFEALATEHFTEIHITDLNQKMTQGQMNHARRFLESMYRVDTAQRQMDLTFNGRRLAWQSPRDSGNIHIEGGKDCCVDFPEFQVNGKRVSGWIALLERGSRADAGFTIIRRGRVIRGWPDSWRPRAIFGQYQGSNDLVNQRLVGEINLDNFGVSHTKDGILWDEGEEEALGLDLRRIAERLVEIALSYRRLGVREAPPSQAVINSAIGLLEEEISSPNFQKVIAANGVVPQAVIERSADPMMRMVETTAPTRTYNLNGLTVHMYLAGNLAQTDPYLGIERYTDDSLGIAINMNHPYVKGLRGRVAVFGHLKLCTYEGLAQWKVHETWDSNSPLLIRAMKDAFLRVGQSIYDQSG